MPSGTDTTTGEVTWKTTKDNYQIVAGQKLFAMTFAQTARSIQNLKRRKMRDNSKFFYSNKFWDRYGMSVNPRAMIHNESCDGNLTLSVRAHWSAFMVMEVFGDREYFEALKVFDVVVMDSDHKIIEFLVGHSMDEIKSIRGY